MDPGFSCSSLATFAVCPKLMKAFHAVLCTCNPSTPMVRKAVETGELLRNHQASWLLALSVQHSSQQHQKQQKRQGQ